VERAHGWDVGLGTSDVERAHGWDVELGTSDVERAHGWDVELGTSDVGRATCGRQSTLQRATRKTAGQQKQHFVRIRPALSPLGEKIDFKKEN